MDNDNIIKFEKREDAKMYSQAKLHKNLNPINFFKINGRVLNLYTVEGRHPAAAFSLYWDNETNPLQHNMNDFEVFTIISDLLNNEKES